MGFGLFNDFYGEYVMKLKSLTLNMGSSIRCSEILDDNECDDDEGDDPVIGSLFDNNIDATYFKAGALKKETKIDEITGYSEKRSTNSSLLLTSAATLSTEGRNC